MIFTVQSLGQTSRSHQMHYDPNISSKHSINHRLNDHSNRNDYIKSLWLSPADRAVWPFSIIVFECFSDKRSIQIDQFLLSTRLCCRSINLAAKANRHRFRDLQIHFRLTSTEQAYVWHLNIAKKVQSSISSRYKRIIMMREREGREQTGKRIKYKTIKKFCSKIITHNSV